MSGQWAWCVTASQYSSSSSSFNKSCQNANYTGCREETKKRINQRVNMCLCITIWWWNGDRHSRFWCWEYSCAFCCAAHIHGRYGKVTVLAVHDVDLPALSRISPRIRVRVSVSIVLGSATGGYSWIWPICLGLPTIPEWPGQSRNWPLPSRVPDWLELVLESCATLPTVFYFISPRAM